MDSHLVMMCDEVHFVGIVFVVVVGIVVVVGRYIDIVDVVVVAVEHWPVLLQALV